VSVVCRQLEVSELGRSLVPRNTTKCVVSECDHEASIMRRPWPTEDRRAVKKIITRYNQMIVAIVDVLTSFDVVTNDNR